MYEKPETITKTPLTSTRDVLLGALGVGVILASTHGAMFADQHQDLTPTDFTAKIVRDLHTHNDYQIQNSHLLVDPKHLRNVRSEGDKVAESDGLRGNWDVYCA